MKRIDKRGIFLLLAGVGLAIYYSTMMSISHFNIALFFWPMAFIVTGMILILFSYHARDDDDQGKR